jgi:DNA-directed RNA polymerase subunit H (RpoH/RPB5)
MSILYNEKEEIDIIINNVVKMLINRNWISKDIEKNINDIIKSEDNNEYIIKEIYKIKFYFQKISSIKKTDIEDFITTNKKIHKILIINDINPKVKNDILEYGNIEIFIKDELMINIIDHILVPKHSILSEDEKTHFFEEYYVKPKDLPRILVNDPISRYYYAKVGDIMRIERPSITSGYSISYRIVVRI